jgi:hypothetical protein
LVIDIIGGVAAVPLFSSDMSEESLSAINQNQGFLLWGLLVGTFSTIVGGFIAANQGKLAPYKNAAIIGAVGALAGVLLAGTSPLWYDIIGLVSIIPAALFGGFLVARKNA